MQVLVVMLALLAAAAVVSVIWWIKRLDVDTADLTAPDTLTAEQRRALQLGVGLSGGTGSIMGGG